MERTKGNGKGGNGVTAPSEILRTPPKMGYYFHECQIKFCSIINND